MVENSFLTAVIICYGMIIQREGLNMALISRNMSPNLPTYGVVCDCILGYIYICIYIYSYKICFNCFKVCLIP